MDIISWKTDKYVGGKRGGEFTDSCELKRVGGGLCAALRLAKAFWTEYAMHFDVTFIALLCCVQG